jgi:hypothetical protein
MPGFIPDIRHPASDIQHPTARPHPATSVYGILEMYLRATPPILEVFMAIKRWMSIVRMLVCVLVLGTLAAGCQSEQDRRDEELRKAAASITEYGGTVLAQAYLRNQVASFYHDAAQIHCWGMSTGVNDNPVWFFIQPGFTGSDGVVCLAIRDPDLQARTTRLVFRFQDGTAVSVPTDGKSGFIVPVPGRDHGYESTIFYDRDYNVIFEHRCPHPGSGFDFC